MSRTQHIQLPLIFFVHRGWVCCSVFYNTTCYRDGAQRSGMRIAWLPSIKWVSCLVAGWLEPRDAKSCNPNVYTPLDITMSSDMLSDTNSVWISVAETLSLSHSLSLSFSLEEKKIIAETPCKCSSVGVRVSAGGCLPFWDSFMHRLCALLGADSFLLSLYFFGASFCFSFVLFFFFAAFHASSEMNRTALPEGWNRLPHSFLLYEYWTCRGTFRFSFSLFFFVLLDFHGLWAPLPYTFHRRAWHVAWYAVLIYLRTYLNVGKSETERGR